MKLSVTLTFTALWTLLSLIQMSAALTTHTSEASTTQMSEASTQQMYTDSTPQPPNVTDIDGPCFYECEGLSDSFHDDGSCPSQCAEYFFYNGSCCVNLNWVIGLAASCGGALILLLLALTIWLGVERCNLQKKVSKAGSGSDYSGSVSYPTQTVAPHTGDGSGKNLTILPGGASVSKAAMDRYEATPGDRLSGVYDDVVAEAKIHAAGDLPLGALAVMASDGSHDPKAVTAKATAPTDPHPGDPRGNHVDPKEHHGEYMSHIVDPKDIHHGEPRGNHVDPKDHHGDPIGQIVDPKDLRHSDPRNQHGDPRDLHHGDPRDDLHHTYQGNLYPADPQPRYHGDVDMHAGPLSTSLAGVAGDTAPILRTSSGRPRDVSAMFGYQTKLPERNIPSADYDNDGFQGDHDPYKGYRGGPQYPNHSSGRAPRDANPTSMDAMYYHGDPTPRVSDPPSGYHGGVDPKVDYRLSGGPDPREDYPKGRAPHGQYPDKSGGQLFQNYDPRDSGFKEDELMHNLGKIDTSTKFAIRRF